MQEVNDLTEENLHEEAHMVSLEDKGSIEMGSVNNTGEEALQSDENELIEKIDKLIDYNKLINDLTVKVKKLEDDIIYSSLKNVFTSLIRAREDIKRTLRAFEDVKMPKDRLRDYKCDLITFKQILKTNSVTQTSDGWVYSGEKIGAEAIKEPVPLNKKLTIIGRDDYKSGTLADKLTYLYSLIESTYNEIYQSNEALLNRLLDSKKKALLAECVNLYEEMNSDFAQRLELPEEEYKKILSDIVERIAQILIAFDIHISFSDSDIFNPEKQIVLSILETAKEEEDGRIAKKFSEEYTYGDHVVFQERIAVFSYKKSDTQVSSENV